MSIFPKLIYGVNTIPIKIPAGFFTHIDKMILKFIWKQKGPTTGRTAMRKNYNEGLSPLASKLDVKQQPKPGNNTKVHQQVTEQTNCSITTQGNAPQL